MNLNKPFGSFLLVLTVLILLFAASFTDPSILARYQLRKVDLLADVAFKKEQKRALVSVAASTKVDSSSAAPVLVSVIETEKGITEFSNDTVRNLDKFFSSLQKVKGEKKKIRIAYFGDSAIEGDLITQDLRNLLQRSFGGSGVGFVPITSNVASFRQSIRHYFSSDWKAYSYLDTGGIKESTGISGYSFKSMNIAGDSTGSWVRFEGSRISEKLSRFYKVRLFYGPGGDGSFVKYNNAKGSQQVELTGDEPINELVLNEGEPLQNLSLKFSMKNQVTIYGLSFEGEDGIVIDNYAFRGNSGMPLTKIPSSVYRKFDELFDYDLVILHYGLNVVSPNVTDFSWYQKGMTNVVEHLKSSFRDASFLMASKISAYHHLNLKGLARKSYGNSRIR